MRKLVILLFLSVLLFTFCSSKKVTIMIPEQASEQEHLAAKEIRRYIYMRTDRLLDIVESNVVPDIESKFIVIGTSSRPIFSDFSLEKQEYLLKNVKLSKKR